MTPKVFNPWNPKNREMTPTDAIRLMKNYGWKGRINNFHLFSQACCHKSYTDRPEVWQENLEDGEEMMIVPRPDNCLPLRSCDNEELEFLGDRVLGLIVATYLFKRYPGQGEGFLTRILSRIVNNKQLGKLAQDIGMAPWLILHRHIEESCDGRNNLRILGSMFEAWMGAMYLQEEDVGRGLQQCSDFLVRIIERHVDFVQFIAEDTNYKDQLLRKFQAMYHVAPRYKEMEVVGPSHDRTFTMGVLDPFDQVIAVSTARNKKVAEQEASRLALEQLDVSASVPSPLASSRSSSSRSSSSRPSFSRSSSSSSSSSRPSSSSSSSSRPSSSSSSSSSRSTPPSR